MTKILVLNPNSSKSMTDGVEKVIKSIDLPQGTQIHYYTAPPNAPASINNGEDITSSVEAVKADAWHYLESENFDGILVACFSVHPLVEEIQQYQRNKVAIGIFESSILTAIPLLKPGEKWGIVTTGKFWEKHLGDGVQHFLGSTTDESSNSKFAGVESTGLNASDFHHGISPDVVNQKIREATRRLLKKGKVTTVVMGCAGMAGMESQIRAGAKEELGEDFSERVLSVVDGVTVGVIQVEQLCRQLRTLRR